MFSRKLILGMLSQTLTFATLLFWPAGTFDWWRAWVLLALLMIGSFITVACLFRTRQDLLNERLKGIIQKGQPASDRVIVLMFLVAYAVSIASIGRDVFHAHLLPKPGISVSSSGLAIAILGWTIVALVFRENSFASSVVRHQAERDHKVVDTGPYAVVRHPMYAGIFLFSVGMALWLESYAGAILALLPTSLLAIRIVFEERFLRRELAGYEAYTGRVPYRLVPYVW